MAKGQKFARTSSLEKHLKSKHHTPQFWSVSKQVIPDDGTRNLPFPIDDIGFGWIFSNKITWEYQGEPPDEVQVPIGWELEAWAYFILDPNGNVTILNSSSNVVANADTDTKLCIGTSVSQEPLVIKNRLGVLGEFEWRFFKVFIHFS